MTDNADSKGKSIWVKVSGTTGPNLSLKPYLAGFIGSFKTNAKNILNSSRFVCAKLSSPPTSFVRFFSLRNAIVNARQSAEERETFLPWKSSSSLLSLLNLEVIVLFVLSFFRKKQRRKALVMREEFLGYVTGKFSR